MSGQLLNATATAASTSSTPDPVADICRRINDVGGDVAQAAHVEARHVAPLATTDEQRRLAEAAIARLTGLGELDEWVSDVTVDEVLVNADNHIWIDRGGALLRVGTLRSQPLGNIIERILAPIGRRLDLTTPIVDARLADGSRVCAVIGPVGVDGASLSIRRFAHSARQLAAFTDPLGVKILTQIVDRRCNVVVSGATSSGKTSLLAALIATLPAHERIVVLEDTAELPIGAQHVVRLEARPPAPDGPPPIDLNDLVRTALRLRPDRLVVGEIRGPEVLGLVQAMNTGHDGSFSTCHANGPHDALLRLESLVLQAAPTWPLPAIRQQLARSLDVVVHISRSRSDGKRRLVSICEVGVPNDDGEPRLVPIAELRTGERLVQVGVLQSRR
ncbi:MAG: pilus assembly protein CpaF [Ilumatobacter sp.]|jgi:pilus assembly protein CpaF